MRKFFHIPLLQCCKPFRLKETQTEISYLTKNLIHEPETIESAPKDSTSYSLEFDTSVQNNSSCNYERKNINVDTSSCGRCTKCLLVYLDKKGHNKEYFNPSVLQTGYKPHKEDLFFSVELDPHLSNTNHIKRPKQTSLDNNVNSYQQNKLCKVYCRKEEHFMNTNYQTVLMFYFKTSVIMINTFQNNVSHSLNFSQAIHLRMMVQNMPISIRTFASASSLSCIQLPLDNLPLTYIDQSYVSKIKMLHTKGKPLCKPIILKTNSERPQSVRQKDNYSKHSSIPKIKQMRSEKQMKSEKQIPPPNNSVKRMKVIENSNQNVISNLKSEILHAKLNSCNKLDDYKNFLDTWKMRRNKYRITFHEIKDSNRSTKNISTVVPKSPDSLTKEYMLKFIHNQFKNKPIDSLKNNLIPSFSNKSAIMKLNDKCCKTAENKVSNQCRTSRNKIIEMLVEIIYEKVIILMVEKLLILSNNLDDIILGTHFDYQSLMRKKGVQLNVRKADILNPSISSTSNTEDYSESTALDVISDQAYSDNSKYLLSK